MVLSNKLKTFLACSVVFCAVCLFVFVVWRAATTQESLQNYADLPVIEAPSGPARVPPGSPGGLLVPHLDKTVFDAFEDSRQTTRVEKLLPSPEKPFDPSQLAGTSEHLEEMLDVLAKDPADPESGGETIHKRFKEGAAVGVGADSGPAPSDFNSESIDGNPISSKSLHTLNSLFAVQLASFRSFEAAEAGWEKIFAQESELLSGLSPTISKVELEDAGGTFYRLQAGLLADHDAAAALCQALTAQNLDCLIVRP